MASNSQDVTGSRVIPAFSPSVDLSTSALRHLPPSKIYPAGTQFIAQGEPPQAIHLIRSGIVKITHTNLDGHEITIGLRSEGWWMSSSAAIAQVDSLATVVAVTEIAVSSFPLVVFKEAIAADDILRNHFFTTQCRELLMMQQYVIMQGEDAATRLRSLYTESKSSAWHTANPAPLLRQAEVANLLAITPEHLSRIKQKPRKNS